MEAPRKGHFGEMAYVPCREVVPISEVCLLFHPNTSLFPIYNELLQLGLVMIAVSSDSIHSGVATPGPIRAQALVNF